MSVHTIVARFVADTGPYTRGVAKAAVETDALTTSTGGSIRNLEKAETAFTKAGGASYGFSRRLYGLQAITQQVTGGVEAGFLGMSGAATVSAAVMGAATVVVGVKSVQAYNAHHEALLRLQETLQKSPALFNVSVGAIDREADALANVTGASRTAIDTAAGIGARFAQSSAQLQQAIPVAVDLARVLGIDVPAAMELLGKGALGSTRPLRRLGISGFKPTGDEAKDFGTVIDLVGKRVSGAGEEFGKTLPGQLDILKNKIHNLEIEIGQGLVPWLTTLAHVLVKTAPAFPAMARGVGEAITKLAPFAGILPAIQDRSTKVAEAQDTIRKALFRQIPAIVAGKVSQQEYSHELDVARRYHIDLAGAIEKYRASQDGANSAAEKAAAHQRQLSSATKQLATDSRQVSRAQLSFKESQLRVTSAQQQYAADLRQIHDLELQHQHDLLGLRTAELAVQSAQLQLNDDINAEIDLQLQHRSNLLSVKEAQLSLSQAQQQYTTDLQGTNSAQERAIALSQANLDVATAQHQVDLDKRRGLTGTLEGQQHLLDLQKANLELTNATSQHKDNLQLRSDTLAIQRAQLGVAEAKQRTNEDASAAAHLVLQEKNDTLALRGAVLGVADAQNTVNNEKFTAQALTLRTQQDQLAILDAVNGQIDAQEEVDKWLGFQIRDVRRLLNLYKQFQVGIEPIFGAPGTIQHRQHGGPVTAGHAYWVNEPKRELFIPRVSGDVVAATATRQAPAQQSGGFTWTGDINVQKPATDGKDIARELHKVMLQRNIA